AAAATVFVAPLAGMHAAGCSKKNLTSAGIVTGTPVIAVQSQAAFWKWSMVQWCRNREPIIPVVIAATFLLSCASARQTTAPQFPQVSGLEQRQVPFQQVIYPFYVFEPSSLNGTHSAPALLLIHSGGGDGPGMIALRENFAETNCIILVGP